MIPPPITFTLERATHHELVYKAVVTTALLTVGGKVTQNLVNDLTSPSPNIGVDAIPGSSLAKLMSQALPNGVTELADLEGSAAFNGSNPALGALDVWLTPGTEQQLLGATDYTEWGIVPVNASNMVGAFPSFTIQAPSSGGTCTISIACRHTRVE